MLPRSSPMLRVLCCFVKLLRNLAGVSTMVALLSCGVADALLEGKLTKTGNYVSIHSLKDLHQHIFSESICLVKCLTNFMRQS